MLDGIPSKPRAITSGVPQGSCLGPLLFSLYIAEIPRLFSECDCSLFADDLKIFVDYDAEIPRHASLQRALNALSEWCDQWNLKISTEKSSLLYLGNNNPRCQYLLNGMILPEVTSSVKDLGFRTTPDLKTSVHCEYLYKKAMARAVMLLRRIRSKVGVWKIESGRERQ